MKKRSIIFVILTATGIAGIIYSAMLSFHGVTGTAGAQQWETIEGSGVSLPKDSSQYLRGDQAHEHPVCRAMQGILLAADSKDDKNGDKEGGEDEKDDKKGGDKKEDDPHVQDRLWGTTCCG